MSANLRTLFYRGLGGGALVLAGIGVVLPVLPTTPFVLVAAWAFTRGAPGLRARLDRHPRFGPLLSDWETRRAIPRSGKAAAVVGLAGSWTGMAFTVQGMLIPTLAGAVMLGVGAYVVTRPS